MALFQYDPATKLNTALNASALFPTRQTVSQPRNFSPAPVQIQGSGYTSQFARNPSNVLPVAKRTSTGGGGTGGVTGGGTQPQGGDMPLQQAPGMPSIDFDAMIAPALQALDAAIGPAQAGYEANVAGIEGTRKRQVAGAQSALAEATGVAGETKAARTQEAEGAINEQRRQLSEISQGLQARYGGTTGTGAFATEIAGSQATRNIGQLRQGLSSAIQSIDRGLEQVRTATTIAIADAEDRAAELKSQARSELDRTLANIRSARGELLGRKAELAANAVQYYQQVLQQVEQANVAFKQQVYLQAQAAEQKLAEARATGQNAINEFKAVTIGQTPEGFNIYGSFDPRTGQVSPFNVPGAAGSGALGSATAQEDDDFVDQS